MSDDVITELQSGDYGTPLKAFHRDAMLDLILSWGKLDGALTILVAAFTGEDLCDTADRIGRRKGGMKLREISKIFETADGFQEAAKRFKKLKKKYEKYSIIRNRIAHSNCVGFMKSDEAFIVFMCAERESADKLVVEAIPVEKMIEATKFGNKLAAFATDTASRINSVRETS